MDLQLGNLAGGEVVAGLPQVAQELCAHAMDAELDELAGGRAQAGIPDAESRSAEFLPLVGIDVGLAEDAP